MLLVKEAMKTVKKKNAQCFEASIQEPNVPFFRRLGWQETGEIMEYHGLLHQRMRADLQRVRLHHKREVLPNEL
jgi:predicted GNAT family N-acyltransferase